MCIYSGTSICDHSGSATVSIDPSLYIPGNKGTKVTLSLRKFSDLYWRVSSSCNYVSYNWTGIWKKAIKSKNITVVSL